MAKMKFSAVIACHNAAQWIQGALASVAAQSHPAHETILVDDDSSDESAELAQASLPDVRILRVKLHNAAATRNAGIEAATGDWIAFLDADNLWFGDHLSAAAAMLAGGEDVAYMAYPGRTPAGGTVFGPFRQPARGLSHDDFVALRARRAFGFPTTGQIFRTDLLRQRGGFDTSQVRRHDIELFMRAIHGQRWAFNPGPTWWSRPPRPGNISADKVKCPYYALRAMALNEARYGSGVMRPILREAARKAISAAILEGSAPDAQRAWELGCRHLGRGERWALSAAKRVPGALQSFTRLRRATPPAPAVLAE